ncbi:MAG TPA: helix-turn-helix domain-containing protein [Rhodanobacteraceae bacterium]|nr:helix-turn-helix domain-containing protein [Rhodanobacteraceae bacterium]
MGNSKRPVQGKTAKAVGDMQALYPASQALATHDLACALFTTTQQRVLGVLYGRPKASFNISELIALTGSGSGAVQRELAKLTASGLLTVERVGNQKRHQANPDSPIHAELVSIVRKTVGLADTLREALTPFSKEILAAFVCGSTDTASSDIDLMIIANKLDAADVTKALRPASRQLQRDINPAVYTRAAFAKRMASSDAFVERVWQQPKLWLIGDLAD